MKVPIFSKKYLTGVFIYDKFPDKCWGLRGKSQMRDLGTIKNRRNVV